MVGRFQLERTHVILEPTVASGLTAKKLVAAADDQREGGVGKRRVIGGVHDGTVSAVVGCRSLEVDPGSFPPCSGVEGQSHNQASEDG